MNIILKSAVAGALALGASSAFALAVPSTNNSDLFLYVDALTGPDASSSTGVYAYDTGITLNSLLSGPYVAGAKNSTAFSAKGATFAPTAALSSFLSSHSGSTFQWTLEGGQFDGSGTAFGIAGTTNTVVPGAAKAVFTSRALTSAYPLSSTATTVALTNYLNGLQTDVTIGGLSSFTGKETATATQGVGGATKYNFIGGLDLAATGSTAVKLFGFTGNGVNGGTNQSYILGSATLGADGTLTIAGNSGGVAPVPLPAAVWLFGSGLLGLVGVSRRRKTAVAAAV